MLTHLYDLLRRRAASFPTAPAIGSQEGLGWRTLDSRDLLDLTDRLALDLAGRGVGPGDRVVLWAPSHWRTPVYCFAIWRLGGIVVPFDREMNPGAGARILEAVQPRLVVSGYSERPAWAPESASSFPIAGWWDPAALPPASGGSAWEPPAEELAALFYTSGTTGSPKGCMISHANLCSQVEALADNIPLDPACRLASILPLSHLFEFTCGLLYPLSRGAAIHYVPSRRAPDVLRVLSEQRITHMIAVPQLLSLMGQALQGQLAARLPAPALQGAGALAGHLPLGARRALYFPVHRRLGGHLRLIASGGAALPADTQRLWEQLGVRIVQGYGASECSPVIAAGLPDGSTPVGSVGRPIRGVQIRLAGPGQPAFPPDTLPTLPAGGTGAPAGASGVEGEVLVKGPNVMRGYWNDPQRTAEVLQDGWYASGDLGTIDSAGNLRLTGRARDLIVLPSGMKVWPQDVEDTLRADPAVADAAVVLAGGAGAPGGPGRGSSLHAYLVPAPGQGPAAGSGAVGEIVARANGHLAQHQRLASASWWPEPDFPRTSTLKVRRHLLPAPERLAPAAVVQVERALAADDPVAQAVAGVARVPAVQGAQTLGELGLDSLALTELALALEEKTGKVLEDDDLRLAMTVDEVRNLLAGRAAQTPPDGTPSGLTSGPPSGPPAGEQPLPESISASQPLWPYTWGRAFRFLGLPFDLLYLWGASRTVVLGGEHLAGLSTDAGPLFFAGTHRSFADVPLLRHALARTPARGLLGRLVTAVYAGGLAAAGPLARYGTLAFGLYPLRQYGQREASLRGLAQLARGGSPVLIFPQGAHVDPALERANDPRAAFKPGVGHLAISLGASVVPFGLAGSERVMPPTLEGHTGPVVAGIPVSIHRGPLAVAFGPPLRPQPGETAGAFAARLQEASFALSRRAEAALGK
jgi:long-chain acyl-CoA synthetase